MTRPIASSGKKRRAQLQTKRATKRGESPPPSAVKNGSTSIRYAFQKGHAKKSGDTAGDTRKLQSRFIALTPEYLDRTRNLAHSTVLQRPLPGSSAVFPTDTLLRDEGRLSVPSRPKFKYGQTKREVERNEEGVFRKWLAGQREVVRRYVEDGDEEDVEGKERQEQSKEDMWPRSSSWFETNLEVWRQLWRVVESSSVILLLLDSRCPVLHCPPSLRTYLQSLKPHKEVVLVLTKADLVDPSALEQWKEWVKGWWGQPVEVASVTSYDLEYLNDTGRHRPDIPVQSLEELLGAIRNAHKRLLQPPESLRDQPDKLSAWTPTVRQGVDWESLLRSHSTDAAGDANNAGEETDKTAREDPLTIGLLGQPNVGKSSLLNALLGEQKVRASKTPGKTKHFQTMYWGDKKEIKMVDCPGLVCPSLVGLEMQALAGILPISQIPSLPACIHHTAQILPLEEIFRIPPPEAVPEDAYAAKKTWRGPREESQVVKKVIWTAGVIMEQRATDRGFVTAKSGRPDANRATNGIMRALADGRVRWGFWPPGADVSDREGKGIWLGGEEDVEEEPDHKGRDGAGASVSEDEWPEGEEGTGHDSNEDRRVVESAEAGNDGEVSAEDEESEEEEEEEEDEAGVTSGRGRIAGGGFFAALEDDDVSDSEEAEEGEEQSDSDNAERREQTR